MAIVPRKTVNCPKGISALTDQQEGARERPWAVDDAPADYLDAMRRGIVGIEVEVLRWSGKWKLSQNHSAERQAGVRDGLLREPQAAAAAVAQAMAGVAGGPAT